MAVQETNCTVENKIPTKWNPFSEHRHGTETNCTVNSHNMNFIDGCLTHSHLTEPSSPIRGGGLFILVHLLYHFRIPNWPINYMVLSGFRVPSNWWVLDWVVRAFFLGPGSSGLLDLVQGYLHTRSIGSGTYCLSLVHSILHGPDPFLKMDQVTLLYLTGIAYLGRSHTCLFGQFLYMCSI